MPRLSYAGFLRYHMPNESLTAKYAARLPSGSKTFPEIVTVPFVMNKSFVTDAPFVSAAPGAECWSK